MTQGGMKWKGAILFKEKHYRSSAKDASRIPADLQNILIENHA
jgi:hypothetical protein